MARTRSPAHDDQRELILARAAALFARQGYPATTMNEVAAACEVSKATLYHYVRDKHALLAQIALGHVQRLQSLTEAPVPRDTPPEQRLRQLIERFVEAYADAQDEHRVLTEDMKFLREQDRALVRAGQRRVFEAFAQAVAAARPRGAKDRLEKPLAMLLFGMINWTYTWMRPEGPLTHAALAPVVADLFLGGIDAVRLPVRTRRRAEARA
ncbi:MAG: TetR/AcrR family transcriptional regulator [Pseudomonadota bacterium]